MEFTDEKIDELVRKFRDMINSESGKKLVAEKMRKAEAENKELDRISHEDWHRPFTI